MNTDKLSDMADKIFELIESKDGKVDVSDPMTLATVIIATCLDLVTKEAAMDITRRFVEAFNHTNKNIEGCRLYTEDDIKPLKDTIDSLKFALNRRTE